MPHHPAHQSGHSTGRHLLLHPPTAVGVEDVYVGSSRQHTIYVWRRTFSNSPADDGDLSLRQRVFDNLDGVDGLQGVRHLVMSPQGNFLYAAGAEDGITVFRRTLSTGTLTFVGRKQDAHLGTYRSEVQGLAVSPDGTYLYVATSSAIVAYARNHETGTLVN